MPLQPEIVTLDANLKEWGAHYQDQVAQGHWPFQSWGIVLNVLELRAAFHNLLTFSSSLSRRCFLLRMDNKMEMAYIQKQEGIRSRILMREVHPFVNWAQVHLVDLKAIYVPAAQNQLADNSYQTKNGI